MSNKENTVFSRTVKNTKTGEKIKISISQPIKEDETTWYAYVEVGNFKKKVHGVDSIQVLILSFSLIREILLKNFSNLEWLEGSKYLGFPLFVPMYFSDTTILELEEQLQKEINSKMNDTIKK